MTLLLIMLQTACGAGPGVDLRDTGAPGQDVDAGGPSDALMADSSAELPDANADDATALGDAGALADADAGAQAEDAGAEVDAAAGADASAEVDATAAACWATPRRPTAAPHRRTPEHGTLAW
jgi:hypothetical protein